jgi:hypothetical protein
VVGLERADLYARSCAGMSLWPGWSTMYPQEEEFHQRHIAEYVKQNIEALAGMPPSLYNRAARFFYYVVPRSIFNWSMRCDPC